MSALPNLAVGDRVAHREDADWTTPGGTLLVENGGSYLVEWDAPMYDGGPCWYDRGELVGPNDPDRLATDEHPLNLDGSPA